MKAIRHAFGFDRAVDVSGSAIERYKASRLGEKKAPATVNRELALIRRAFRLGLKQKLIATMPSLELLAEQNARPGFFEHADLEALIGPLPHDLRDFTRFAYLSGWRKPGDPSAISAMPGWRPAKTLGWLDASSMT
jgi:site-specific recombinase XerD